MKTLARVRQSTSIKTRTVPLPEAFALATIATAARNIRNPRDARRASVKVMAVLAVLAVTACGGQVGDATTPDYAERYAHDACSCADTPCDESAIVAELRKPGTDVECVESYSDAMETRAACTDRPTMPTCEVMPGTAAERFARAVCACGSGFAGCHDNVIGEVRGAAPADLNARAAAYEHDCSGRAP